MPNQTETVSFSKERLQVVESLEEWHFWFWGRQALVERLLRQFPIEPHHRVLDLGCGTGRFYRSLQQKNPLTFGIDIRPEGLRDTKRAVPHGLLIQADISSLPIKTDTFDWIIMQDVMEHIEDDQKLSQAFYHLLRPGGHLLLTVPAFMSMWSYRDVAAGHFRRYTKDELKRLLTAADLQIHESRYFMFLLLPFLWIMRRLGRQKPKMRDLEEAKMPVINEILKKVLLVDVTLAGWLHWPVGSSIVIVASKPQRTYG